MFIGTSKAQAIHINPVFKDKVLQKIRNKCEDTPSVSQISTNTHINPRFINAAPTQAKTIYMNPEFLNANFKKQKHDVNNEEPKTNHEIDAKTPKQQQLPKITQLNKIISKSRTRIVREHVQQQQHSEKKPSSPILLLTKRKLVRAAAANTTASTTKHAISHTGKNATKRVLRFKLDHKLYTHKRDAGAIVKRRPATSFVARYALRRCANNKLGYGKTAIANAISTVTATTTSNRQLRLININGILYRCSQNKLQRRCVAQNSAHQLTKPVNTTSTKLALNSTKTVDAKTPKGRTVYVRGTKFILDPQGFKLTRVSATTNNARTSPFSTTKSIGKFARSSGAVLPRRIDIGGHTYVASSSNVFVRTSTHLVLAHLNQAKHRSVSVLSRCLRKVNRPCAIFQRLGKCAAYERNRCSKIHDKKQVIVCPKFIQGVCSNENCLLSHIKTYQKMPVCKFFLQGCCVRDDCPYLHKKLSEGSDVCDDFRRGFCALGEKCDKQHVFPKAKSKSFPNETVAAATNYIPMLQQQFLLDYNTQRSNSISPIEENAMTSRYFTDESFISELTKLETASNNELEKTAASSANDSMDEDDASNEDVVDDKPHIAIEKTKRKPLGSLPAFIPLC